MADDRAMGDFNPYQAPASTGDIAPGGPLDDWLARPSASLSRVRSGIGLMHTGNMLMLGGFFCGPLFFVGPILILVGQLYCLAAPPESGARGAIYASVALIGLSLPAPFVGVILEQYALGMLMMMVLSVIGYLLFVVFLLQLTQVIGKKSLIGRARFVLGFAAYMATGSIGLTIATVLIPNMEDYWYLYLIVGAPIIVFFASYMMLLNDLSQLLRVRRIEAEPKFVWPASES